MITNDMFFDLLTPIVLYAETHYSFKGIYSRLKKNEPEIIADAPHRVEPNLPIPIMLLIKDSHHFPVKLNDVEITMMTENTLVLKKLFQLNTDYIQKKYHWIILELEPPSIVSGLVKIDVKFEIVVRNNRRIYHNDNYRISSHEPLEIFIADQRMPRIENWFFGEMHFHSSYTEDQAEFGAPLEPSILMSRAMGLNFFAATDHSYDLDDYETNYLNNDPELRKWENFNQEIHQLNEKYKDFVILQGEEISAGNVNNRNVHLLVVNNNKFIPGKGDSAEKWFRTKPDLSISQVLQQIDEEALAIAAHPEMAPPFLQWLLIRRGKWRWQDYQHDRLNGIQIWNGSNDHAFEQGVKRWVDLLLNRRKIFIYAGNDAHGNFNRFRQIGFPFWTFRESKNQIFGKMRTALKIESSLTHENIIRAIKQGNCIITDGPVVDVQVTNQNGDVAKIGENIEGKAFTIQVNARSTPEFGKLFELKLHCGDHSTKKEILLKKIDRFENHFNFYLKQKLALSSKPSYLRLELISSKMNEQHRCLTNPIWIE